MKRCCGTCEKWKMISETHPSGQGGIVEWAGICNRDDKPMDSGGNDHCDEWELKKSLEMERQERLKKLAEYLSEYMKAEIEKVDYGKCDDDALIWMTEKFQQGIEAYESTENVMVDVEDNVE